MPFFATKNINEIKLIHPKKRFTRPVLKIALARIKAGQWTAGSVIYFLRKNKWQVPIKNYYFLEILL